MKKLKILPVMMAAVLLSACAAQTKDNETKDNGNVQESLEDGVVNEETQEPEDLNDKEEIVYDKTGPFLMTIDETYNVVARGTMVVGTIERGQLDLSTELNLVDDNATITTKITGMFMGNTSLDVAGEGDHVCLKLANTTRSDVYEGEIITNDAFSMVVESGFSVKEAENDYSVYAIGVIESGQVEVGDAAEIVETEGDYRRQTHIEGIQTYCESIMHAEAGDRVVLLLRGISIDQTHAGQTLEQIE